MTRGARRWHLRALALAALLAGVTAHAEPVSRIRLMPHPYAAPNGEPDARVLDRLRALSGLAWRIAGSTPTGAVELVLATPMERSALQAPLQRLRSDRAVLWVDTPRRGSPFFLRTGPVGPTDRLLVRLAPRVGADWATLLPRFQKLVGQSLAVERQTAGLWVLRLSRALDLTDALLAAGRLANDPAVRFADPVKTMSPTRAPNDPMLPLQWGLHEPAGGINAPAAWDAGTGSADVVIAVIDTGVVAHPDLDGRLLPGYDFVSDPDRAADGDERDADPSDPGDAADDGECSAAAVGNASSWHGTAVAGILGARTDNAAGVAGVDWNARLLPVRALGRCGGSELDVMEAILWAAGDPVPGAPLNPDPARVINLSFRGEGPCSSSLQQAIDAALAQGAVVVAAAGNDGADVSSASPANCAGVIAVAAHDRNGVRAGYSNFGPRIDLSAPGGAGEVEDWVLSTSNDGEFQPAQPITAFGVGTSYAAPYVSGAAALMLGRNRLLTPGQVLTTLQAAARAHPPASLCTTPEVPAVALCGSGLLDAGSALARVATPAAAAPPGTRTVVEYHRADLDRYLVSADPREIAELDASLEGAWRRTGVVFHAYPRGDSAAGLQPVCRLRGQPGAAPDARFYGAGAAECAALAQRQPGAWAADSEIAFHVAVPDRDGRCAEGSWPVYRLVDDRQGIRYRYVLDLTSRRALQNRGWIGEGRGPDAVAFCSPL